MDPPNPIVNESSFSAANPSSYTLSEIWPFPANDGLGSGLCLVIDSGRNLTSRLLAESSVNKDGSVEESTVTEQSGGGGSRKRRDLGSEDESSKIVSTSSSGNALKDLSGKKGKISGSESEYGDGSRPEGETSSGGGNKMEQKSKPEPPKDYIHVRARRGQATDRHSLAERARREKISERMKVLQDLVPGCNKIIGKALVLDEIINYLQSLQRQVEFLSMKLEVVNSGMTANPTIAVFPSGDLGSLPLDVQRTVFDQQEANKPQGSQPEWLHMQQPDGNFGGVA